MEWSRIENASRFLHNGTNPVCQQKACFIIGHRYCSSVLLCSHGSFLRVCLEPARAISYSERTCDLFGGIIGVSTPSAWLGGVLSTIEDTNARGALWWTNIAMEIGPFQDLFSIQNERFQLLLIFTPQDIFPPKLKILAPMCFKQQSQLLIAGVFVHRQLCQLPA